MGVQVSLALGLDARRQLLSTLGPGLLVAAAALGYSYPRHPVLGVLLFVTTAMLLGIWFGWLWLASGSVVPPSVAHGAFNAIGPLPLLVLRGGDPAIGGVLWSPVGWVVLLVGLAALWRAGALRVIERREPAAVTRGRG